MYSNMFIKVAKDGNPVPIYQGVIQGNVSGPWLFNKFLNPLIMKMKQANIEIMAYADDIVILCRKWDELLRALRSLKIRPKIMAQISTARSTAIQSQ
jgi:hypothetical protein